MKFVRMTHPTLPDNAPSETTDEAFSELWEEKGWVLVQDDPTDYPVYESAVRGASVNTPVEEEPEQPEADTPKDPASKVTPVAGVAAAADRKGN